MSSSYETKITLKSQKLILEKHKLSRYKPRDLKSEKTIMNLKHLQL